MKKLLSILIVAVFALVLAGSAYAEDRLTLSGSYFARGYDVDNDWDESWTEHYMDSDYKHKSDGDTEQNFVAQRMRIQAVIAVADDVKAIIRADITDTKWGYGFNSFGLTDGFGGAAARPGNYSGGEGKQFRDAIDFDRSYVDINKEMWGLKVGQQYMALGTGSVLDINATGVNFGLKFEPVQFSFLWAKVDENDDLSDEEDWEEDTDIYAVNASFMLGGFDSNFFYAFGEDQDSDEEVWAVGFHTAGTLGIVNLTAELDVLGGDNGDDVDYSGLNFYLKADSNVTDMINVGGELLYAQGEDDEDDRQVWTVAEWGTMTPMGQNTPMAGFISGLNWAAFDPSGASAGVIGGTLFFSATPMDKLSLGAKVGYFMEEEDKWVEHTTTAFNAWVQYEIASNTNVYLTYLYSDEENDYADGYDWSDWEYNETEKLLVLGLAVSF